MSFFNNIGEEIIDVIISPSTWVIIISVIIAAIYRSKILEKALGNFLRKKLRRKRRKENSIEELKKIKESDVINHDIFNYLNFWINNKIPTITLKTGYRTVVFRKYLTIYFETYRRELQSYVNSFKYKNLTEKELKRDIMSLFDYITITYESKMRQEKIPEIIINKMKVSNTDTINLTLDLTNSVSESHFYDTEGNLLKIYTILNIIHSILENILSNIEVLCNTINGELIGLSMNGHIEPNPDDENV